jgi:hypothetical protein
MGQATAIGQGGTNYNNPGTVGGPNGMLPFGPFGFSPLGLGVANVVQQVTNTQQPNNFSYTAPTPSNPYGVDYAKYTSQPTNQNIGGEAFNNGVNSDSGIAAILAGLYNSGVFNQQNTNPYAPQGTVGSFSGIPYGQQQESMFSRQGLASRTPYGGYQGQSWNPYGNYYTANNTSMGGGNTNNNNIAPPQGSTGPDALQQLSFMMNRNNTQI